MNPRILIIDDDKFTRQVLCKILRRDKVIGRYKPEIVEASNGMEGLRLYEKHKPILAIVDLLMPKMDGFEVCKRLREAAGKDELTIAVTSGVYKDASISKRIHEDFQAEFFAKPYQIKQIAEFVADALSPDSRDDSRAGRAPARSEETLSGSLKKRSAAKILLDHLKQEKTGRLVLRRAQVVRQIELYVGHPVSVTTNVREETLGHFLVSKKRIDSETHSLAMSLAANRKMRFGEALIEMGVLNANELIEELTAQTRFKLVNALRWRQGTWSFRAGEPRSSNSNALNVVEVIVAGLAATAQLEPPPPAITALSGKALTLNARGRKLLAQIATSISPSFAENFGRGTSIEKLETAGVNQVEIFSCLDVLLQCDGIESKSAAGVPAQFDPESSDSINLREIAHAKVRTQEGPDLIASLFDNQAAQSTRTGRNPLTALGSGDLWKSVAGRESPNAPSDEAQTQPLERRQKRASVPIQPQTLEDDEVVDSDFSPTVEDEELAAGRKVLLEEYLRIQEKTLYEVLELEHDASEEAIQAAYQERHEGFDKTHYANLDLGRDFLKLDVLHATYDQCLDTLLDEQKRKDYDESIQGMSTSMGDVPSMDAEIAFRQAERFLAEGNYTGAMGKIRKAVEIAPSEAAYQAELGWAIFVRGNHSATAADEARPHINNALRIAPDDVLANEYKGLIHAHLGDDIENALLHLERALGGDPRRVESLRTIEQIRIGRNEYQALEQLYRRLLFRLKDSSPPEEALIWSRLGDLHQHYLKNSESALIAYQAANRLTPQDELLQNKVADLQGGDRPQFYWRNQELRERWQEDPTDPSALRELFAAARNAGHNDGEFLAASGLVTAGHAEEDSNRCYQRYRPRFLLRAQHMLDAKCWAQVLFPEDYALLGALYALLEPSMQAIAPSSDAEAEVSRADLVDDAALPEDFRVVRAYVAHVLGVAEPAIYSRGDYGRVIHVAALKAPTLLAGYDMLTCTDKIELAFHLGRAMSYLRPGRAIVAGCPRSILKSAMLACYSLRSPEVSVPDPDGKIEEFKSTIQEIDPSLRYQVTELVAHISQEHPNLNLSRWVRTLNRTADRVGLLLCGDLPTALRCVGESGDQESRTHLFSFGVSAEHMQLRQALGLSIDV